MQKTLLSLVFGLMAIAFSLTPIDAQMGLRRAKVKPAVAPKAAPARKAVKVAPKGVGVAKGKGQMGGGAGGVGEVEKKDDAKKDDAKKDDAKKGKVKAPWTIKEMKKYVKAHIGNSYKYSASIAANGMNLAMTMTIIIKSADDDGMTVTTKTEMMGNVTETDKTETWEKAVKGDGEFKKQDADQKIKVPAGTFDCKVYTGKITEKGQQMEIQVWCVKNKPGVFAKMIMSSAMMNMTMTLQSITSAGSELPFKIEEIKKTFAKGTKVKHKTVITNTKDKSKTTSYETIEYTEVTNKGYKCKTTTTADGKSETKDGEKDWESYFTTLGAKSDSKPSDETITLTGTEYKCKLFTVEKDTPKGTRTLKSWFSADKPGLLVKSEIVAPGTTLTTTLESYAKANPKAK